MNASQQVRSSIANVRSDLPGDPGVFRLPNIAGKAGEHGPENRMAHHFPRVCTAIGAYLEHSAIFGGAWKQLTREQQYQVLVCIESAHAKIKVDDIFSMAPECRVFAGEIKNALRAYPAFVKLLGVTQLASYSLGSRVQINGRFLDNRLFLEAFRAVAQLERTEHPKQAVALRR